MICIPFIILSLNVKIFFLVFKASCINDNVTAVTLLAISIFITLSLSAISAKLKNTEFNLSIVTTVLLVFKILLIMYFIVGYIVDIHSDIMLLLNDLFFTYIIPLFIVKDLLSLSMNQPITGWVHYPGNNAGNNGSGGNGGGGPGQRPDPNTLASAANPYYNYNPTTGIYTINDPSGVINSTNGRFNPNHTYNRAAFFGNAERFLAMNRDEYVTLIPRNLEPTQLSFLQDMRREHYQTIDHPNSNRTYRPFTGGSSENSRSFREHLRSMSI
jgi:hypothetical protein